MGKLEQAAGPPHNRRAVPINCRFASNPTAVYRQVYGISVKNDAYSLIRSRALASDDNTGERDCLRKAHVEKSDGQAGGPRALPSWGRDFQVSKKEDQLPVEPEEGAILKSAKGPLSRRLFMQAAAASAGVAAATGASRKAFAPPTKLDTPTLECVDESQVTIFLQVCAGASGAPAGFTVQWQPKPPDTECGDVVWPDSTDVCKGSFSGVPGCSIYNLGSNACRTVEIGNLLDAECGVGLENCGANELRCGTEYVFRAFAHNVPHGANKSDFTANLCCATEDCVEECRALSQGYWKQHACNWPAPFTPGAAGTASAGQCGTVGSDPNTSCACDDQHTIKIGNNDYNQCELLCALTRTSGIPGGNALVTLAHQLITAELNILNGAAPPDCDLDAAHALIGDLNILTDVVPSGGPGNILGPAMNTAAACLEAYNTHCEV
jgi:hypothetical protein